MTIEQANEIEDVLVDLGYEVEVRDDYSGRGMYGATVPAFVADDTGVMTAIGYAAAIAEVPLEDLPRRTDSMGRGVVIY